MELDAATIKGVTDQQTGRLVRESQHECLLGAAGVLIGLLALKEFTAELAMAAWAGLGWASYGVRYLLVRRARAVLARGGDSSEVFPAFAISLAVTGVLWGAAFAWVLREGITVVGTPLMLLGLAIVMLSVAFHAGTPKITRLFVAAVLLPPALTLLSQPLVFVWPSLLGFAFFAAVAHFGGLQLRNRLWQGSLLEDEATQLRSYLDQRRNQVEKLKVEVKASQNKRDEAEIAMRRMAADLGLLQGKSKALSDSLERLSPIDQVTGLDNRRHFEQTTEAEWGRAAREGKLVSLLLIEMDGHDEFAAANNRQTSDLVLKRLGMTVRSFGRRPGDNAARYDESRVALLLPGCDSRNAERLAESVRKKIETITLPQHAGSGAPSAQLTAHIGVATAKPMRGVDSTELYRRAEAALYEAGFHSGNRVIVHRPLSKLRVERWDLATDGPLSEQSMMQKLLVWGYETKRDLMPLNTKLEPQSWDGEVVLGIMTGELRLEVEGHDMTVKSGDCVVVPLGVELGQEVIGSRPVLKFTANKLK